MKDPVVWDDARLFLAIARHGTLSAAAQALGMGVATVSRKLARLEAALAMPLFSHHQNGYQLTADGHALLARAEALEQAGQAFVQTAQQQNHVAGTVRLATAENLANPLIIPSLPALRTRHPDVYIEIVSGTQTVNLHRNDADLAVRMHPPENGNLIIKRLGTLGFGLYGSHSYMQTRRTGANALLCDDDACIGWAASHSHLPQAQWLARLLRGRACALTTNTLSAQLAAAQAGLGLAVLPHFLARAAHLVCLLPDTGVAQPIWLVIHANLAHTGRVRAVADHLIQLFEENQPLLHGNGDFF